MTRVGSRRYSGRAVVAVIFLFLCGCLSDSQAAPTPYERFPVTVNYDRSIEDYAAAGGYYRVYSEISTKSFPSEAAGSRDLQVSLVRLRDTTPISRILAAQSNAGLRPATIRELLAFAETYPDLRKRFTISAFGSWREYSVSTYERFGMGPDDVEVNITRQKFFPSIDSDPLGLALVLIQEDMIPAFDPGAFYGCFVAVGQ
jgi:hypothetical protein